MAAEDAGVKKHIEAMKPQGARFPSFDVRQHWCAPCMCLCLLLVPLHVLASSHPSRQVSCLTRL